MEKGPTNDRLVYPTSEDALRVPAVGPAPGWMTAEIAGAQVP